jgi:hypothetical protein
MANEPALPQLFLLRVWREGSSFRAALREVGGTEAGRVFTRPEQLGEFLLESRRHAPPASEVKR